MKKTKLAALISLTLANVAGLCFVTFAWFQTFVDKKTTSDTIQANKFDDVTVEHEIFEWDDDLQEGVECLNNDGTYKFGLEQYDSYITERNAKLSKVIRFSLKRSVISDDAPYFKVTIPCSGLLFDSNNMMTNSISNIIRFKYFVDSTNNGTDPDEVYNTAMTKAADTVNPVGTVRFVSLNNNNATKTANIVIDGLSFSEGEPTTYFFLEYNYDVDLINYYYEHSDMDAPSPDSLEGDEVAFVGDIHRMVFGVSGD